MFHQQTFPNNWYILDHSWTHMKLLRNKLLLPFCYRHIITSEHKNKTPKAPETLIANNLTARRKAAWCLSENWVHMWDLQHLQMKAITPQRTASLWWEDIYLHHSAAPAWLPQQAAQWCNTENTLFTKFPMGSFSLEVFLVSGRYLGSLSERKNHDCSFRSCRNLARKRETFCNLKNLEN